MYAGERWAVSIETFRLPEARCPRCDYKLDAASTLGGDRGPEPEDVTVCARCRTLLIFTHDMAVRELTDGEWLELPVEIRKKLERAQDLCRMAWGGPDAVRS